MISIFVAGTEVFRWSKSPTVAMFASPDHFCAIIYHLSREGSIHPADTQSEWSSVKLGGGMREEERRGVTLFLDKGRDREIEKTNFDEQDGGAIAPPFGGFLYHNKGHF